MKILFIVFFSLMVDTSHASGLMNKEIVVGHQVRCEGWPDYEKDKTLKNKRFILGEILAEEDVDRISIYGKILNPLDPRDRYTTPFLLLKKMCLYYSDYISMRKELMMRKNKKVKKKVTQEEIITDDDTQSDKEIDQGNQIGSEGLSEKTLPTSEVIPEETVNEGESNPTELGNPGTLMVSNDEQVKNETVIEVESKELAIPQKKQTVSNKTAANILNKRAIKEIMIGIVFLSLFRLLYPRSLMKELFLKIKNKFGRK